VKDYVTEGYAWNEQVKNYCRAKKRRAKGEYVFYEPLEELKVSKKNMDKETFIHVVLSIYYKRTGYVPPVLAGIDKFIEIARVMGVYEQ
jgi:hypothetical protein